MPDFDVVVTGGGTSGVLVATAWGDMLVGAAAVGLHAEEWMGELTLAIRAGLSVDIPEGGYR